MKKFLMTAAIAMAFAAPATAQELPDSVGDCISDGFYGNQPNMADGTGGPSEQTPGSQARNVLPSQSPGPKATNPDGTVRPGASIGDVHQEFGGGYGPEFCRAILG